MDDKTEALRLLLRRFLIALPFFIIGGLLLAPVNLFSLLGIFPLLIGGFIIVKPLVVLLGNSAGSVIFSPSPGDKVNLMFSIPETRIMQGKYDEALSLLRDMIPMDPGRLEIYQRIMRLAIIKMKQPEIARDTFHSGLKNITDLRDRKALAADFKELMGDSREKEMAEALERKIP